jgi:hypothetical protein
MQNDFFTALEIVDIKDDRNDRDRRAEISILDIDRWQQGFDSSCAA